MSAPIRDPAEIYRRSFAIIRSEADLARFDAGAQEVVVRMIHACGMVDLADDIVVSAGFAEAAKAALAAGAPVICDVEMVRHGVIGRLMPSDNQVLCLLNDPQVREVASAGCDDALGGAGRSLGRVDGRSGDRHRQCADGACSGCSS